MQLSAQELNGFLLHFLKEIIEQTPVANPVRNSFEKQTRKPSLACDLVRGIGIL